MTAGTPSRRALDVAAGAALALVLLAQAVAIWRASSAAYDEPYFLRLGVAAVREGRFGPIVAGGVAPLPVLVGYALPAVVAGADAVAPSRLAWSITLARVSSTLAFGLPLVLIVYAWLARRRGRLAGLAGGALLALSPTVVAHTTLATTDAAMALTSLLVLAALAAYCAQRSPARSLLVAGALGLAFAAKYSAVFLLPVAAMALLPGAYARWARAPGAAARTGAVWSALVHPLLVWTVAAGVVAWAFHLFATAPLFSPVAPPTDYARLFGTGPRAEAALRLGRRLPVPLPLKGFQRLWEHGRMGHPSFLDGETSAHGRWDYFPRAFAMKSTPVELLLVAILIVGSAATTRARDPTARLWRWAILIYGVFSITSPLNLGVRHLLLLYVLLVLVAIDGLAARLRAQDSWRFGVAALALVIGQMLSAAAITPHQLSYFNRFFGGPADGYRHLVDSNLDWGQDLPALRDVVARLGIERLRLAYFGLAPPAAYGVVATPWNVALDPDAAHDGWLAISATHLQGPYLPGDPFAAFRLLTPDARAAYSIFLYDLRRPEPRLAFERATATPRSPLALKIVPAID